jgi:hypothetical protein
MPPNFFKELKFIEIMVNMTSQLFATTHRMQYSARSFNCLTLETICAFSLLPDNIQYRVNKFSTLCVMSLGPVVSCSSLSKHEVVWPENLTIGTRPDTVHGTRLQIHEDSTGDIASTASLIVVDIDAL